MKTKISILCGLMAMMAASCAKSSSESVSVRPTDHNRVRTIPLQDAIGSLELMYQSISNSTKNEVKTLPRFSYDVVTHINTKDELRSSLPDTLLYILNFVGGGSAVLSATTAIPYPILCVTEKGEINVDDLDLSISDYFYVQEEDREMLDSEIDTLMFGRIGIDDDSNRNMPWQVVSNVLVGVDIDGTSGNNNTGNSGGGLGNQKYGPLLETKWGQGNPFNKLVNRPNLGCVATASSQIIAYEKPDIESVDFQWDTLMTVRNFRTPWYVGSENAQHQVAIFCQDVASQKNCNVNNTGGATALGAKRALKNYNLKNVRKHCGFGTKNQTSAKNMIKGGKPVFLSAAKAGGILGHAFVLDGYLVSEGKEYFHINWGWTGTSDGYYSCGVFDTEQRQYIDPAVDSLSLQTSQGHKYSWCFRMLTYDK